MTILLLLVRGGGELYRLTPFASFGPQKHGAQVLLHGARTDFQMAGYFLVAAPLHQQPQDLRVAGSYFYVVPISHFGLTCRLCDDGLSSASLSPSLHLARK